MALSTFCESILNHICFRTSVLTSNKPALSYMYIVYTYMRYKESENTFFVTCNILFNSSILRLSWLPIWEDKDEMESVYGYLCELLESNSPAALGPQGSNLPHIVRVIAEIFARNVLAETSPTKPRLVTLLRMIQANDQLFQSCFVQLSPELQQSLQGALQV